jgi:hypothetical protein
VLTRTDAGLPDTVGNLTVTFRVEVTAAPALIWTVPLGAVRSSVIVSLTIGDTLDASWNWAYTALEPSPVASVNGTVMPAV